VQMGAAILDGTESYQLAIGGERSVSALIPEKITNMMVRKGGKTLKEHAPEGEAAPLQCRRGHPQRNGTIKSCSGRRGREGNLQLKPGLQ